MYLKLFQPILLKTRDYTHPVQLVFLPTVYLIGWDIELID